MQKNRDLADIIRDNSMCTMLLTSFARINGATYLVQCLKEPLNDIMSITASCEVDGSKLINDDGSENNEKLMANRKNLETVSTALFLHILDNQKLMPNSLMRMCHFIETMVAEIVENRLRQPVVSPENNHGEPVQLSKTEHIITSHNVPRPRSNTSPNRSRTRSFIRSPLTANENVPPVPMIHEKIINQSMITESPLILEPSCVSPVNQTLIIPNALANNPLPILEPSNPVVIAKNMSTPDVTSPTLVTSGSSASIPLKTIGTLSQTQKVVGSFLFLRYFVPCNDLRNVSNYITRQQHHHNKNIVSK